MTVHLLMLIALYAGVAILACWLAATARLPWLLKLALIVGIAGSCFVCWKTLGDITGWPTSEPMPQHFLFHAATIEEPDEQAGVSGSLIVWATRLRDDGPDGPPRAYRIPYKRSLHERIQMAIGRMREGHAQIGSLKDASDDEEGRGRSRWLTAEPPDFELRTLPSPALPEK
jgi:hypothetical protein